MYGRADLVLIDTHKKTLNDQLNEVEKLYQAIAVSSSGLVPSRFQKAFLAAALQQGRQQVTELRDSIAQLNDQGSLLPLMGTMKARLENLKARQGLYEFFNHIKDDLDLRDRIETFMKEDQSNLTANQLNEVKKTFEESAIYLFHMGSKTYSSALDTTDVNERKKLLRAAITYFTQSMNVEADEDEPQEEGTLHMCALVYSELVIILRREARIGAGYKIDTRELKAAVMTAYFYYMTSKKIESEEGQAIVKEMEKLGIEIPSVAKAVPSHYIQEFSVADIHEAKASPNLVTAKLTQAKKELLASEAKVAAGIKTLHTQFVSELKEDRYDAQGIASIVLTKELLAEEKFSALRTQFPDNLEHGIVLHVYKDGFIKAPPIQYMIQEQVRSLCEAARQEFAVEFKVDHFIEGLKINEQLQNAINDGNSEKTVMSVEERLSKNSKIMMERIVQQTVHELYKRCGNKTKPKKIDDFAKTLFTFASQHRPAYSSVSFDTATHKFSYDSGANISAHDRRARQDATEQRCSNLSLVYEGDYSRKFHVTSSVIKHASLAPKKAKKPYELVETYKNAREVVEMMVMMRLHGGAPRDAIMVIDWDYLLLTSNAGNWENQEWSYLQIVDALHCLNGSTFKVNVGTQVVEVSINATVFNAGINKLASSNLSMNYQVQIDENRKAYIHATDVFTEAQLLENVKVVEGEEALFKNLTLLHPVSSMESLELRARLRACQENLYFSIAELKKKFPKRFEQRQASDIRMYFSDILTTYEDWKKDYPDDANRLIQEFQQKAQLINAQIHKITTDIEKGRKPTAETQRAIMQALSDLKDSKTIKNLQEGLNAQSPDEVSLATEQVLAIAAYVYKAYMDNMYYSSAYREPENAVLFNSYCAAFQRITGMLTSIGCKSGNDRTYVARLFLAAIEGRDLSTLPIPPNFAADRTLIESLIMPMAFTNIALHAAICDTRGGTPKSSHSKFPFLPANFPDLETVGEIFAAHKQKENTKKLFKTVFAETSNSPASSSSQPAMAEEQPVIVHLMSMFQPELKDTSRQALESDDAIVNKVAIRLTQLFDSEMNELAQGNLQALDNSCGDASVTENVWTYLKESDDLKKISPQFREAISTLNNIKPLIDDICLYKEYMQELSKTSTALQKQSELAQSNSKTQIGSQFKLWRHSVGLTFRAKDDPIFEVEELMKKPRETLEAEIASYQRQMDDLNAKYSVMDIGFDITLS